MLEDQLHQITKLKSQLAQATEDLRQTEESHQKYQAYYDDKLQQEIDETDR